MRVLGIDPGYAIVGWGVLDYAGNRFAPVDFGHACSHLRSFDSDRARAAERIDECLGGIPAREHQKTCRKVFLQGSLAVGETPAALEERFARKIQIEGAGVVGEEGGDAHVGVVSLDVGTTSREVAEAVADAVLDAEHGEVDRFERAALAVGRDLDRQVGTEPLLPRGVCSHFINVACVPVGGLGDLHEHAAGSGACCHLYLWGLYRLAAVLTWGSGNYSLLP